jgi:nicotinate-nucleotide pyrophosphorylase (carboxylating)
MLEKYAVLLGGGVNGRYGLDDGVLIKANHAALAGGVGTAVKSTREKIGHLHKIEVEVTSERELKEALENGADALSIEATDVARVSELILQARETSPTAAVVISGAVTTETARAFAEAGADLIRVDALTQSVRAMDISFQIQAG